MRVCPSCGKENAADVDFCENCGQYIRWEATSLAPAVKPAAPAATPAEAAAATEAPPAPPLDPAAPAPPAAPAATPPAAPPPGGDGDGAAAAAAVQGAVEPAVTAQPPPPEPVPEPVKPEPLIDPDSVVMDLGIPGVEVEGPVTVSVQAGGNVRITLLIRNQSGIVDNYDITIQGLPDTWWTVTPPTVYLVPYGTASDGYEQEVMIDLHPPRSAEAEARPWLLKVAAGSRAYEVEIGTRDATLVVEPYYELESEMRPERKSGRKKARFAMAIRNKANAPADIELTALDSENKITFDFERPTFPTKPGRRAGSVFYAKPLKQIWFGRKLEHRFTVNAQAVGADAAAVPRLGVMVQKPWIPYWVLVVLPLLILAAIAAYLLWPRTVVVPNVRETRKLITAQKMLEKAGLKLGKVTEHKTDLRPPGSPINASPSIGSHVKKGRTVDLVLAVGTGLKIVPDVVGLNLADADAALKEAGFQIGQQTPAPSDPAQKVQKQVPVGNKKANLGSPIDLFFAETKTTSSTTTTTTTTTTATTTTASTGEKKSTTPVLPGGGGGGGGGGDTAATDAALAKLGIVFDNGNDILIMGAKTGKPVKKLAASPDVEVTPAVSADGTQVAYARGPSVDKTQIWLVDPKKPQFAHALTNPGFKDRHPVFAPNGKIVAFIRTKNPGAKEDSDLCFIPVSASAGAPSCIVDPSMSVSRPAWSPDGQAILVVALEAKAQQLELVEYTSNKPSSGDAKNWNSLGFITDKMHGQRAGDLIDTVAWAPDGKSVALSANWGSNAYHVVFVAAAQDVLDPKKAVSLVRVRACELTYLLVNQLAINQRDNTCSQPGVIVRFDPSKPDKLTPLTKLGLGAEHPVLSPTAP